MKWKGVMPAVTTKFTASDELDLEMFSINLQAQLEAGVEAIILGGSLGEASTLTNIEKQTLVEYAVRFVDGKVPIVMNIAERSTRSAITLAKSAMDWGAKGLMLLPPMQYKATDYEVVGYFQSIASNTDLPIMIYNNPVDYKIEVTLEMFDDLLKLDNIMAVKESTRDITNITRIKNAFGDRLKILCGVDTLALESIAMGADGWVAGLVCAFPSETVAIYKLVKAGRMDEAISIYRWFMPLLELDINPQLVQNIKLAEVATEIGTEHVRAPRLPLQGKERERVLNIIKEGVRNRPNLPDYKQL